MTHATSHHPSSKKQEKAHTGLKAKHAAGSAGTVKSASAEGMRSPVSGKTKVSEFMTRDVRVADPSQTIREAAAMMAKADVGSLPVGENDRLVGMITDRDIVLRAVAEGRNPDTSVREVMTERIRYCHDDDSVHDVARNMAELGVRRLPVINRDKRLVGIVALSNITHSGDAEATGELLDSVATPH